MSYLLAILSIACALTTGAIWLAQVARKLVRKRNELAFANRQLVVYSQIYAQVHSYPERQKAWEQAQLSREIYRSVVADYNRCIAKPVYRPVAKILGFSPVL